MTFKDFHCVALIFHVAVESLAGKSDNRQLFCVAGERIIMRGVKCRVRPGNMSELYFHNFFRLGDDILFLVNRNFQHPRRKQPH